jgi:ribosome-binding protein aMBF1 (putative translation factor)
MSDDERAMAREYRRSARLCRETANDRNPIVAVARRVRAWAYDQLADRIERDLGSTSAALGEKPE